MPEFGIIQQQGVRETERGSPDELTKPYGMFRKVSVMLRFLTANVQQGRTVLLIVLATFDGCTFYDWNVKHAYVTPWTHLSRSDHDEIIRLISYASEDPIVGITAHRPWDDGSTVSVFTGKTDQSEYKLWTGYELKRDQGKWRITFHGEASPIVAQLALSKQSHDLEERRR